MAFHQPTQRPQPLRQLSFATSDGPSSASLQNQRKRTLDESEEWVLFSPQSEKASTATCTAGHSRISDFGSLETSGRLSHFGSLETAAQSDKVNEEAIEDDGDDTEHGSEDGDGTELDSLDDGLHAFHEPVSDYNPNQQLDHSSDAILPSHDGLGTFQMSSTMVQEQLYAFERYNPRRLPNVSRRRSSMQRRLDALQEVEEADGEEERRQRIETWRMEHSKVLLEEIEKETRRMRRISRSQSMKSHVDSEAITTGPATPAVETTREKSEPEDVENESFWQRVTRRVIRNLIGIDDSTLAIILGEELPAQDQTPKPSPPSSIPNGPDPEMLARELRSISEPRHERWEHRLLDRIAHELGILVHQLSEHPGAFSTYLRTQTAPDYAGISASNSQTSAINRVPTSMTSGTEHSATYFPPTVAPVADNDPALWGIEEEVPVASVPYDPGNNESNADRIAQDQDYWERELDVKMVFSYLLKRFAKLPEASRPASSLLPQGPATSMLTSASQNSANPPSTLASARRAALIRQTHPLANAQNRRRTLAQRHQVRHQSVPALRRPLGSASSCASQSTKKSKSSSRNYWDIGGSGSVHGEWGV